MEGGKEGKENKGGERNKEERGKGGEMGEEGREGGAKRSSAQQYGGPEFSFSGCWRVLVQQAPPGTACSVSPSWDPS